MSKLNYNKQRHLELLKLKYSHLTSTEKSELNEYWSLLDNTLDWETKEQYIDLLEKLISRKINSFKFYIEFKERNNSNGEVFDSLKANSLLLSPNEKSKEFSNFISEITGFCYSYSEVFESKLITKSKVIYLEEILYYKYALKQLESSGVKLSLSN